MKRELTVQREFTGKQQGIAPERALWSQRVWHIRGAETLLVWLKHEEVKMRLEEEDGVLTSGGAETKETPGGTGQGLNPGKR